MGVLGSVMPKFKVDPYAKKYIKKLEELGANTYNMCGRAIFPCAEIIANEIEKEIQKLPTAINEHGSSTNMINTITPLQKYGLMHGMGISHMQLKSGGTLDVKTGYHGYNKMVTDNYRRGQPNVMIARSVLHGTSFRRKNDYEGRAIRRVRKEALESMQEEINKETEKIMK